MYLTKESEHEYRFGDHGPMYLTKSDNADLGIVVITPNEAHPCHFKALDKEKNIVFAARECCLFCCTGSVGV